MTKVQRRSHNISRENIVRTSVRPTPENSFREMREVPQKLAPVVKQSIGK
jgi:hypothetical protein